MIFVVSTGPKPERNTPDKAQDGKSGDEWTINGGICDSTEFVTEDSENRWRNGLSNSDAEEIGANNITLLIERGSVLHHGDCWSDIS